MEALENYIESLKGDIPSLINGLGEFKKRAEEEAMSFVNECKEDLIKWTEDCRSCRDRSQEVWKRITYTRCQQSS